MGTPSPCDRPPYSHVPFYQAMNAAFDHLQRWVKDGTLPPSALPIETSSVGPPAVVVRDSRGNALGGIRHKEAVDELISLMGRTGGTGRRGGNGGNSKLTHAIERNLKRLTGQDFKDENAWRAWWKDNKATFKFA